jgi:DnaJ-class molecular chaperone
MKHKTKCTLCNGKGSRNMTAGISVVKALCPTCKGTGKIEVVLTSDKTPKLVYPKQIPYDNSY